ncbi:MAG TPA: tetraacyldisaccharide 4'-kinase [Caldimonas sp.]
MQRAWNRRGPLAALLLPLATLFAIGTRIRRALYRVGWLRSERLPVRVIVVGNLVAGGAGKTPTVLALVAMLRGKGYAPGVVSRGYGGRQRGVMAVEPRTPARLCGDEPLLLRRRAGVPVFVGRDRVAAARALLREHPDVDLIVSDDGLQHLRLAHDVAVLVFDERGAGNGWMLPAGPLREPLPPVVPLNSLVLYNAPQTSTPLPGWIVQRRLSGAVALQDWWQGQAALPATLDALKGRTLVAAAGMGRPDRFFAMLREAGLDVAALPLPDHCDYATLPWPPDAADVVVTEKDAVKLDPARMGATRIWVAALDFVLPAVFDAQLLRLLGPPSRSALAPAHGNSIA